jgi:hypothetical protein
MYCPEDRSSLPLPAGSFNSGKRKAFSFKTSNGMEDEMMPRCIFYLMRCKGGRDEKAIYAA